MKFFSKNAPEDDPYREAMREDAPPTLGQLIVRWATRATVLGMVLSLLAHLAGIWITTMIATGGGAAGGRGTPSAGPVELAIVTETELRDLETGPVDAGPVVQPDLSPIDTIAPPLDIPSAEGGNETAGPSTLTPALGGGGDIGDPGGAGVGGPGVGGSGGGGGASFFGVEARGTRFVYVVDVSGSMGVGGKIEALRGQLIESIEGLTDASQFFIIPFSGWAQPLGDKKEWTRAGEAGKRFARREIPRLVPLDSTNPLPAFDIAFTIRPRPDAIYFMTDGQFDPSVAESVAAMNKSLKVPIHCIAFVSRESEPLMRRIAQDSDGTYTFIAGPGIAGPGGTP